MVPEGSDSFQRGSNFFKGWGIYIANSYGNLQQGSLYEQSHEQFDWSQWLKPPGAGGRGNSDIFIHT